MSRAAAQRREAEIDAKLRIILGDNVCDQINRLRQTDKAWRRCHAPGLSSPTPPAQHVGLPTIHGEVWAQHGVSESN
jgi:hypothetical protein